MTVATFEVVTVAAPQADVSVIAAQPRTHLDMQVWTTVTAPGDVAPSRGMSTLVVFPGLRHALRVRIYEALDDVAVEDPQTGVFGAGNDVATAVQDFQDALQEHLAVLAGEEALSPALQHQLALLQGYFTSPDAGR